MLVSRVLAVGCSGAAPLELFLELLGVTSVVIVCLFVYRVKH